MSLPQAVAGFCETCMAVSDLSSETNLCPHSVENARQGGAWRNPGMQEDPLAYVYVSATRVYALRLHYQLFEPNTKTIK
jgi:hypothetical protein